MTKRQKQNFKAFIKWFKEQPEIIYDQTQWFNVDTLIEEYIGEDLYPCGAPACIGGHMEIYCGDRFCTQMKVSPGKEIRVVTKNDLGAVFGINNCVQNLMFMASPLNKKYESPTKDQAVQFLELCLKHECNEAKIMDCWEEALGNDS